MLATFWSCKGRAILYKWNKAAISISSSSSCLDLNNFRTKALNIAGYTLQEIALESFTAIHQKKKIKKENMCMGSSTRRASVISSHINGMLWVLIRPHLLWDHQWVWIHKFAVASVAGNLWACKVWENYGRACPWPPLHMPLIIGAELGERENAYWI